MEYLIDKLNHFNKSNFPVDRVTKFLENKTLNQSEISDYALFKNEKYSRNLVYKDKDFEVLIVCWGPGQCAPIHGHEGEKCWMRIESGSLQITNYRLLSLHPLSLEMINQDDLDSGSLDGPADIHSVKNISNQKAVSLHIYTKPFAQCDIYLPEKGVIERKSLVYDSINKIPC